ncbi:MAG TPA: 5-methylcytosine-specific restriction endonuclease system specificity protein McrC [Verrucomicrobiae bacterium]
MNIPIQNIYYLLCYAWDKLTEKDVVAVEGIDSTTLADLFASVLINGTKHLLKRGFDRGYISHHEWTQRLRGRICFQEAVGRTATARLPCEFDELSYDVLHNRILKATMLQLMRRRVLDSKLYESLAQLCRLFSEIKDIELSGRLFGQVQLHRNNQFYDFLLKICELIHRNLLVSERAGNSKFIDFVRDRREMAILFENFVRNFYRIHFGDTFHVAAETLQWRWDPVDQVSEGLLPKMVTDISLTSRTRKIVIDCKFTPEATQRHYEAEKLRSAHLYQINAYMDNLKGDAANACEMMLLYPMMDAPLAANFTHKGHKIGIRTINLDQPWNLIHRDLLALIQ